MMTTGARNNPRLESSTESKVGLLQETQFFKDDSVDIQANIWRTFFLRSYLTPQYHQTLDIANTPSPRTFTNCPPPAQYRPW